MKKLYFFHMVYFLALFFLSARAVLAATAMVPDDYATIQAAVDAVEDDADPGEVIINSDATFDESVFIRQSVTLMAGSGFSPVIERTVGGHPPVRIRSDQDAHTVVIIQDIDVRTPAGGPDAAIRVANQSLTHQLSVTLDHVSVDAVDASNAVSVASTYDNAGINITIVDSLLQVEAPGGFSSHCVHLNPSGYDLVAVLRNNTFRFSEGGGIDIKGGNDLDTLLVLIDGNVFEVFDTPGDNSQIGVTIGGTGTPGAFAAATTTYVTNNLFAGIESAIDVDGQWEQRHTVYANNNTIVDSHDDGLVFEAYGTSTIDGFVANNIIAGSAGFGIYVQNPSVGTINLNSNYNLLYANAAGNYDGVAPGLDSLDTDPMFTQPGAGNYRLQPLSPAVDSGTNTPAGGFGFGLDLDGTLRIQDSDGDTLAVSNMGAYEVPQSAPPSTGFSGGGGGCFISAIGR